MELGNLQIWKCWRCLMMLDLVVLPLAPNWLLLKRARRWFVALQA